MKFRNIIVDDYLKYIKLINSNVDYEYFVNFLKNILNKNHKIIVIIDENNEIIGTGTVFIEYKLTHNGCKMGHLENILIDKNYQGKGYGEKLVEELLRICKNNNCYRVDLNCNKELTNFYNKNGFNINNICMNVFIKENFT